MTIFKRTWEGFRKLMQKLLLRPVVYLANRFSSAPNKEAVFKALTELYNNTIDQPGQTGEMLEFDPYKQPVVILSDQHKGAKNGADDFATAEPQYLAALDYYFTNNYYYINLGDSEELWENNIFQVMEYNTPSFAKERLFIDAQRHCKVYGNHDSIWQFDPLGGTYLKQMYGSVVKVFGSVVLRLKYLPGKYLHFFCTHGHQGDAQNDGNWFSAWFVANLWVPLQLFLRVNPNTPFYKDNLKTLHNKIMYEWSAAQQGIVLVTGHTHQPVFNSLTHLERLYLDLEEATSKEDAAAIAKINAELPRRRQEYNHISEGFDTMKPTYYNSGCCCYSDGTITGIEIAGGFIRLVLWSNKNGSPIRTVAEEMTLEKLATNLLGQ